jgi:uncharacterized protein YodC (DUF2158 family)
MTDFEGSLLSDSNRAYPISPLKVFFTCNLRHDNETLHIVITTIHIKLIQASGFSANFTKKIMAKFKIGDVVMLKSGGPDMTIVGESDMIENGFEVKWFNVDEELQDSEFPGDALEKEDYEDDDEEDEEGEEENEE